MKERLAALLADYFRTQFPALNWAFDGGDQGPAEFAVQPPRDAAHGDLASNAAMVTAKLCGQPPRELALALARWCEERLPGLRAEVAGPGFLNFRLPVAAHQDLVARILAAGADYGRSEAGGGQKVDLEFVSANPTGPPVVVSARAAAFGSTLANLLAFSGHAVTREYYLNDAGSQVDALGESLRARWRELQGEPLALPENGYHGLYVKAMAEALDPSQVAAWETLPAEARGRAYAEHALAGIVESLRSEMSRFRTDFDVWFSERSLHDGGKLDEALSLFEAKGLVYEADGARWFRSSDFGDDKDRVVLRSDGRPTYFLADAAYHLDKLRRGYDKALNVLGPDHHGHVARMQAIAQAIGAPEGWLEILLLQWVTLVENGETVAMSKRAGEFVTMGDLVDDVGVDVARTYFLARRRDSHLEFDLVQAREQSSKSRVFYAQYATARIAGILRKAEEAGLDAAPEGEDLARLTSEEELGLIRTLAEFPDQVAGAAAAREPNRLFNYLSDVAAGFHRFYHERQVVGDDAALSRARLALCRATRQVLANGLGLMAVDAPERM
ncbi:MAG: arginine--tRNA ligase [Candidatus Latescibacteria bacterium]|nr:arginine--tRNA ligase [Candidatus Latescibacterota bacterium]